MKRKNKFLTVRLDDKTANKVAQLRELERGLVTRIVTDAINNYKEKV